MSQPQKITSRLKTMFNLSPICSARKSSNHKLIQNYKICPDTKSHKQNIHKHQTKIFRRISPFGITSLKKIIKKHIRLGHSGIVDHSVDLSIPDFKKVLKKEWTEAIKNSKILNKCITANTSVIWQHAAHTTDQLSSPNC